LLSATREENPVTVWTGGEGKESPVPPAFNCCNKSSFGLLDGKKYDGRN